MVYGLSRARFCSRFGCLKRAGIWAAVLFFLINTFGCKVRPHEIGSLGFETAGFANPGQFNQLLVRRDRIGSWVLRCGRSVAKERCDVGESALFNGLLCLSGDELSCEALRRSQGADGRVWRAEYRLPSDAVNSFSREMALGVLAYLVATKDVEFAIRWMSWIEKNEDRFCRESTDDRCEFNMGLWMLFHDVWQYLGLAPNQKMKSAVVEDSVLTLVLAQFLPTGVEMHVAGVNAQIRRSMGQKSSALASISRTLNMRQPKNPFFAYLFLGARPEVIDKTLAWCPVSRPSSRTEWSFERHLEYAPWQQSMGWECIMLMNFLIRDLRGSGSP
ncbi:MAG: hypothetical protein ACO3A4_02095 [Silvanigrellaceae bacterium]